jgi:cleavage stimulation factor subunit 3
MVNHTVIISFCSLNSVKMIACQQITCNCLIELPGTGAGTSGGTNAFDEILKATPPALVAFLANLPAVDGNFQYFC